MDIMGISMKVFISSHGIGRVKGWFIGIASIPTAIRPWESTPPFAHFGPGRVKIRSTDTQISEIILPRFLSFAL
jgi:hypothetical protein